MLTEGEVSLFILSWRKDGEMVSLKAFKFYKAFLGFLLTQPG